MVDLTSEINKLRESPIFALSKGNNELSHSNFWAWLIEIEFDDNGKTVHPFVEVFIKDFYPNGFEFMNVTREEANRDLSIHYLSGEDEKIHVVENKLKSIPDDEQLERYEKALGCSFAGGTLTGVIKTIARKGWTFMSYSSIADIIESITEKYASRLDENLTIINTYIADIRAISKIVSGKTSDNAGKYIWTIDEDLERIKLADIYLKQLCCIFGDEIRSAINKESVDELKSKWGMPVVEPSYNNKKPTMTVIYKHFNNDNKEDARIGVQIEGDQFRLYGGCNTNVKNAKNNELFHLFRKYDWLEDYKEKKIRKRDSGMQKNFCKYSTSKYTHIYQHWSIDKWINDKCGDSPKPCTTADLCTEVLKELKIAKEKIDRGLGDEILELKD